MEKKIIKKLLAILMIITILTTDFFVLGSSLITYATQISSETNNANIEFSVYFKESTVRTDSIEKSIKDENLKLYAEVKVKNDGYFNGAIEIQNSNFNLIDDILPSNTHIESIEGNKVNLKQINAGDVVEVELGIKPIVYDKLSVDMLSKTSIVKLTGTYMEETYEGLDINAEKLVCVNYQVDENAEAELETSIITNKIFSVQGINKRIVQLLIKSRLTENQYPVKQTTINVHVPQLSEKYPEEVNVIATGKLATNGETEISTENWNYEDGIVQIVLNNEADENNEISWNKNIYDELVVSFIYPEDVDASMIETITDSKIQIHNSENTYTATHTHGIENQELNSIIMGDSEITTTEIYKGQLYANINATEKQNILYNTLTTLIITNADIAEEIVVQEGPDVFGTEDSELEANTKYISTEVNKEKMLQILGTDGNIAIKNGDTTTVINKDSEVNENGNVVVNYTNSSTEISITTSNPVNAGILEIINTKAIIENSYTRKQINTLKTLKTNSSVLATITVDKEKQNVVENSTEASIELKETISKAELTINKQNLSTAVTNENVILGIKLITDGEKYDLYKNPTIKIQLPEVVENVELNEAPSKLYADEFEISANYDSTNKLIQLDLTGEQTTYPESSATQMYLQLNLNMTLSKTAPTQTDKITMTYINENASLYEGGTTDVGVVEQPIEISAPVGLIKTYNLASESNTSLTETVIKQITSEDAGEIFELNTLLVNNTGTDINNIRILGILPTTGNTITGESKENTLETTLTSVAAPNATIYYTENASATTDIENNENGWTTNLEELTNAKLYLIKVDSLIKAGIYEANVKIQMPNETSKNTTSYTQYEVTYNTDVQTDIKESSRKIGLTSSIAEGLEADLIAEVGPDILNNGDIVKVGEVIKYTATIKNNGTQNLENIELKVHVPEGTVLVKPKDNFVYVDGYYEENANQEENTKTISLAPGETYNMQYEVRVKTGTVEGTEISNTALITYNGLSMETNTIKSVIAESNVRVSIKKIDDLNIKLIPGNIARYTLYVENLTNETISDLDVKIEAENLIVNKILYVQSDIEESKEDIRNIHIDEISANGIMEIRMTGYIDIDALNLDVSLKVIDSNNNECRSNIIKEVFEYTDATITLSSPQNNTQIQNGDIVEYNIVAKNISNTAQLIRVDCDISSYLDIQAIYINKQLVDQTTNSTDTSTYKETMLNLIEKNVELDPGEEAQIDIKAKVAYILEKGESKDIYSKAEVKIEGITKDTSEEIKHILINPEPIEDLKNVLSGFVWLDQNGNGKKDNDESVIKDITVKLYDISMKNYLTDNAGNVIKVITNDAGEYSFSKIVNGSYRIVIEYDTSKYELAENSIVKLQQIELNGNLVKVIATDLMDVEDNISNLNISIKENETNPPTEEPVTPEKPETPDTPEKPETPEEPETPDTPGMPENPEKPGETEKPKDTKLISGYVWLDENRDGEKDSGETILPGIKVRIYSVLTKNYLKDDNGNIVETITNNNGEYTFNNIEKGSYIILFEYDTEEYKTTTYLANGVDTERNSKAITKNININGEDLILAVTDTINVQDDVFNINLGLKENLIFDLELNKYISKIVVQNNKGTDANTYENKSFAKVEIYRKQVSGSLVVLEYTIKIKNTGEIAGYAKNIVDYIPNGLAFSSELNPDWYISGNNLYTKGLENTAINPGEEKEIKLILTKTMTNENIGLINNRSEIYQDYNKYGEIDIDSTPNNQKQDEDDFSSVDVIIGVSTGGSTIMNLILLIINIILIGIVIKLMIKNGIIKIPTKRERR